MSLLQELVVMLPEIVLLVGACALLMCPKSWVWPLTLLSFAGAMVALWVTTPEVPLQVMSGAFQRAVEMDVLRGLIVALSALVLLYARDYTAEGERLKSAEFYALALFGCVGMFLISGARHLIVLYMGLEVLALSLYPMVAMRRDDGRAAEAAIKYFVLGALASGFLLYGISLLYAVTGSLHVPELSIYLAQAEVGRVLLLGLVFMLAGLAFKLGAVPFHMWLPDVYDGTSVVAAAWLSAAPKIAGLLLLLTLFGDSLAALASEWGPLMMALAVLSLTLGNLVAIMQTRIRRMLAYSAIAHTGFVFLALCVTTPRGMSAAVFYTLIYAIMAGGGFGMLLILGARTAVEEIGDFRGLGRTQPWLALMMLILMFSMAGVPLTAGFYAKLYVLQAVLAEDLWVLAALTVVLAVIGAFYYLRIVWYMYFEEAQMEVIAQKSLLSRSLISLNALLLVWIFLRPQAWLEASQAVAALFVLGR